MCATVCRWRHLKAAPYKPKFPRKLVYIRLKKAIVKWLKVGQTHFLWLQGGATLRGHNSILAICWAKKSKANLRDLLHTLGLNQRRANFFRFKVQTRGSQKKIGGRLVPSSFDLFHQCQAKFRWKLACRWRHLMIKAFANQNWKARFSSVLAGPSCSRLTAEIL